MLFVVLQTCDDILPGSNYSGILTPTPLAMSPAPLAMLAPLRSAQHTLPIPAPLRSAQHALPAPTVLIQLDRTDRIRLAAYYTPSKEIGPQQLSHIRRARTLKQISLTPLLDHSTMIEHQDMLPKKQRFQILMRHKHR